MKAAYLEEGAQPSLTQCSDVEGQGTSRDPVLILKVVRELPQQATGGSKQSVANAYGATLPEPPPETTPGAVKLRMYVPRTSPSMKKSALVLLAGMVTVIGVPGG